MTYKNAKNLQIGDTVIVKKTNKIITVDSIIIGKNDKTIIIQNNESGCFKEYLHTEIK